MATGLFSNPVTAASMPEQADGAVNQRSKPQLLPENSLTPSNLDQPLLGFREEGFGFGGAPLYYMWYNNRLQSFCHWPKAHPISDESLAGAGFYYTDISDKVKCFWCKTQLHQWEVFDSPIEQHKKHSKGDCNFLKIYFPSKCLLGN